MGPPPGEVRGVIDRGYERSYFEAPTAAEMNLAFTQIGKIISTRLIK